MVHPLVFKQMGSTNPHCKCQNILWDIYLEFTKKIIVKVDSVFYKKFEKIGEEAPVIFIIGPPRSGTTLLYQTMIDKFLLFYPTNFLWKVYRIFPFLSPAIFKLSRISYPPKPTRNYESVYGRTPGLYGPSEFGEFWYKFFPQKTINSRLCVTFDYMSPNSINDSILNILRAEINYIYKTFRLPLIFKNVYNTVRVHGLIRALPRSVFIVTWRDPLYLSASIFNARIKMYNNKNCWFSVAPKEIKEILGYPVWDQIMLQIYYLYNQILEYIAMYGGKKFYMVDYQLLAENPLNTLDGIALFLKANNIRIKERNISIEKFSYRKTKPMDPEEKDMWIKSYQKYRAKFERLYMTLKEKTWKGT